MVKKTTKILADSHICSHSMANSASENGKDYVKNDISINEIIFLFMLPCIVYL